MDEAKIAVGVVDEERVKAWVAAEVERVFAPAPAAPMAIMQEARFGPPEGGTPSRPGWQSSEFGLAAGIASAIAGSGLNGTPLPAGTEKILAVLAVVYAVGRTVIKVVMAVMNNKNKN